MPTDYDDDDFEEEEEQFTEEQQAWLVSMKKLAPEGTTILTIARDVTEGENAERWLIALYALGKDFFGQPAIYSLTHYTSVLLELPMGTQKHTQDEGVIYESAGSDVGLDLVQMLSSIAYGRSNAYNQVWL